MPLPVSLDKVVEEIDESIEGCGAYINRRTGEIVSGDLDLICKEYCVGVTRREMLGHLRSGMSVGMLKSKMTDHALYNTWEEFRRERIAELTAAWLTEKGIAFRK
jgi:hypothetical protein